MGKKEFRFLKNARAEALQLENDIEEAQNQIGKSERKILELSDKLSKVGATDFSKKKASRKEAKTREVNRYEKAREGYIKERDDYQSSLDINDTVKRQAGKVVVILMIAWVFLTELPTHDPVICENGQEIKNTLFTGEKCPEWGEDDYSPAIDRVAVGWIIIFIAMIIFYAAWAYQESLIEEKMKEIKENLESLSNPAAKYDNEIRNLAHAEKNEKSNKMRWEKSLEDERSSLEENIKLVSEKNSQLLKLLKSIEHLIP